VAAGGAGETALLEGDSESVASATLQELLQAMFMQAGVQLRRCRATRPAPTGVSGCGSRSMPRGRC
jgi:hypothetical protein